MGTPYLGKLKSTDPLYEILLSRVCPGVKDPSFLVSRTSSRRVYKYTEEKSGAVVIGKFFRPDDPQQEKVMRQKREFDNLVKIRGYGFDAPPCYVVRPLTREESIGLALAEEFIPGKSLDHALWKAIFHGKAELLKERLSSLALFFHLLHGKTERRMRVDLDPVQKYFRAVIDTLHAQRVIPQSDRERFFRLMDIWLSRESMQKAKRVTVHGDATPTNFIFRGEGEVAAIDLERMRESDRAYDVSMICGELKHAFLWRTGNPHAAEHFIRYFVTAYCCHFGDPAGAFREITLRNPFYMALTELRISRNGYLGGSYRKRLAAEALECLRGGLALV
ncbi:MAG: aminoglycoside phosphotransferase family protein [Alphaproteobacteria bacterium]|uniref:Aminoglycoside phosphotransferase family protein n=1 Tax=Candidatus Nitrobium versatile TaxID=2884831 RepID=A0A953J8V1_9BACT|nr:aminoglycoside phosphotransferase family protein [Candidatus Nitrobium versatile]